MAIKRGSKVEISGSSASMTDLMFLLLIFLMIATTLINTNALKLNLPKSTAPSKDKVALSVSLTGDRKVYVGTKEVTFETLGGELKAVLEESDNRQISLRGDKTAAYEDIVKVMNVVRDMNKEIKGENKYKLDLATNPE